VLRFSLTAQVVEFTDSCYFYHSTQSVCSMHLHLSLAANFASRLLLKAFDVDSSSLFLIRDQGAHMILNALKRLAVFFWYFSTGDVSKFR